MTGRIPTGVKGLDSLLEGGFPKQCVTLLSGSAGTGKTLMGLHFLSEGAQRGEKCYYLSFSEKKDELLRAARAFDSLSTINTFWEKNLQVDHLTITPDFSLQQFTELISRYPAVDRIVIDNVNKLLVGLEKPSEYRASLSTVVSLLREKSSASLLLFESSSLEPNAFPQEIFDADGAIHLSYLEFEEKPSRVLQLIKMRYTAIEPLVRHVMTVDKKGIRLEKVKVI